MSDRLEGLNEVAYMKQRRLGTFGLFLNHHFERMQIICYGPIWPQGRPGSS